MSKIPPMLAGTFEPAKAAKSVKVRSVDATPATIEAPKEPSPAERIVSRAHDAKVRATSDWIEGHITNAKHDKIHQRANQVIKAKGRLK
jgi:hypothetical protein